MLCTVSVSRRGPGLATQLDRSQGKNSNSGEWRLSGAELGLILDVFVERVCQGYDKQCINIGRKFVGLSELWIGTFVRRAHGKDPTMSAQGCVVALCLKFGFYINLAVAKPAKYELRNKLMKNNMTIPFPLHSPPLHSFFASPSALLCSVLTTVLAFSFVCMACCIHG